MSNSDGYVLGTKDGNITVTFNKELTYPNGEKVQHTKVFIIEMSKPTLEGVTFTALCEGLSYYNENFGNASYYDMVQSCVQYFYGWIENEEKHMTETVLMDKLDPERKYWNDCATHNERFAD